MESGMPEVGGNYSPPSVGDDGSDPEGDDTYVSSRVVFAALLLIGLLANCALVVYILRGQRRLGSRHPPQLNLLLVSIHVVANVVSCLVNGVWIVYTAAVGRDSGAAYASLGCSFDAAAVQMIVIVHAVGLALMSVDRLLSVRGAEFAVDQRGLTLRTAVILIAVAWLYSIALSLPLVVVELLPLMVVVLDRPQPAPGGGCTPAPDGGCTRSRSACPWWRLNSCPWWWLYSIALSLPLVVVELLPLVVVVLDRAQPAPGGG